ncbi:MULTISPECIES: hypothetical protein [unclassified Spirillospora]|uniref:hypothetical protein n=1 Tax=unclassified Spirillospora TaxID=2642701 RepID=UPI0037192273
MCFDDLWQCGVRRGSVGGPFPSGTGVEGDGQVQAGGRAVDGRGGMCSAIARIIASRAVLAVQEPQLPFQLAGVHQAGQDQLWQVAPRIACRGLVGDGGAFAGLGICHVVLSLLRVAAESRRRSRPEVSFAYEGGERV